MQRCMYCWVSGTAGIPNLHSLGSAAYLILTMGPALHALLGKMLRLAGPPGFLRLYPPGRRLSPLRVIFGALGRRPRGERLHGLVDAASQPVGVELGVVDEGDLVLLVPVHAVVGSPRAARTGRSQAGGRGREGDLAERRRKRQLEGLLDRRCRLPRVADDEEACSSSARARSATTSRCRSWGASSSSRPTTRTRSRLSVSLSLIHI